MHDRLDQQADPPVLHPLDQAEERDRAARVIERHVDTHHGVSSQGPPDPGGPAAVGVDRGERDHDPGHDPAPDAVTRAHRTSSRAIVLIVAQ